MNVDKKSMRLYAVTDRTHPGETDLAEQVEDALRGGVTFVQLREKHLDSNAFIAEAKRIKAITDRYHVPFVINDNLDVALACGADGVHVGQSDMAAGNVRALLGSDKILGVSAATVEQARAAQAAGADYIGVGAVFSTSTKADARPVSHAVLREICDAVSIPVVAIGGITTENLLELTDSGADGVAVVSALFSQPDPFSAARKLRALSERMAGATLTGAIFDMDGTLLDSMYIWDNVGADYLREHGIQPPDELAKIMHAMSLEQCAVYFHKEFGISDPPGQIVAQINRIVEGEYFAHAPIKGNAAEFVRLLHDMGVRLCVATATARYQAEAALARVGILQYFDDVLTCSDVGAGKDKPLIFEQALTRLGTAKEHTIIFEDAVHAVITAKKAGFRVVAVHDKTAESYTETIREAADSYLEQLSDCDLAAL